MGRRRGPRNFKYSPYGQNYYNNHHNYNQQQYNHHQSHGSSSSNSYGRKGSSLFLSLKDKWNMLLPHASTLTLDEILGNLKLREETILISNLSSLCEFSEANPKEFNDEFNDRIMPVLGELFKWEGDVGDKYIFVLNKMFCAVYDNLPVKTMFGVYDKLVGYILPGLYNKKDKMKVVTLHILQEHVFPRCPATMNKDLFYKYLNFLDKECIIGKVHIDVVRAGLHTLPDFLEIYARNNDSTPDPYVEAEIRDGQFHVLYREPLPDFDYTFGGTVVYHNTSWYPTGRKEGLVSMALCCYAFLAQIIVLDNFPLKNYINYMADSLGYMNEIIKRYVTENNVKSGIWGNSLINVTKNFGLMVPAAKHKKLSGLLRDLHEI